MPSTICAFQIVNYFQMNVHWSEQCLPAEEARCMLLGFTVKLNASSNNATLCAVICEELLAHC